MYVERIRKKGERYRIMKASFSKHRNINSLQDLKIYSKTHKTKTDRTEEEMATATTLRAEFILLCSEQN